MPLVEMHIDKFGRVVRIDSDHPLAVAQRAKGQGLGGTEPQPVEPPADAPAEPTQEAPRRSKRTRG